ncbi:MAG: ribonuclease HI family protein [Candidatus Eisenbacteria bacterium]
MKPDPAAVGKVARRLLDDPLWESLGGEHPATAVEAMRGWIERKVPGKGLLRLFSDGGSHGNPGPSGGGGVILDVGGTELDRYSLYFGDGTNNTAEYKALLAGLERLALLKPGEVEIFLDSELIVRQIEGRYKVKSPALAPLFEEVRRRLALFEKVRILHIPREKNGVADGLVQEAIKKGKTGGGGV